MSDILDTFFGEGIEDTNRKTYWCIGRRPGKSSLQRNNKSVKDKGTKG